MNFSKDRKPSRPDIQDILSRMKSRFINEGDSDNDDHVKEENNMVTTSVVESTEQDVPVEKSPDDEIAELMHKLNGHEDEELVASIKSRKKMHENQAEVDSTSSILINSDETEQEKPRIILTLRPNENKPDTYVSSSNLTDLSSTSPKEKQQDNEVKTPVKTEVVPLKRSARRSNIDNNQTVLNSAIARKEKKFNIEEKVTKRLPKRKIKKKNPVEVTNEVFRVIEPEDLKLDNKYDVENKPEPDEEIITDQKKKKKKVFRGGRYNIFKKKSLQKIVTKKVIFNQLNSDSTNFDVNWSETNSEKHSASVCSDLGTLVSSDRNDRDDLDASSVSNIDVEDKTKSAILDNIPDSLCLCSHQIDVFLFDEGTIVCKAEDCIDGNLIPCQNLALHFNDNGNMPMVRANIALPFMTFCGYHMKRFMLHHSCPRCGRFCSEGIYMMCKKKHFSHIGCHQKDKGCIHCGIPDVYDVELKRHIVKHKKEKSSAPGDIIVEIGNNTLSTIGCPPQIDKAELSKYLKQLKDEIANPKRTMYSVLGLYQACETNNIKKVISIIGAECNLIFKFPKICNRTALHIACLNGNLMIIYLLLQAGVNPNVVDDKMKSPLRMAAKSGHSIAVQYLLNFNGAPEIKDLQGMTALHLAAKNGHIDCCKVILNKHPFMINWKDKGGWTPLVWACENSHIEVVKYFISLKPNTNIPDEENNVALHWAAVSGCFGVVKCLVEYDPEVNVANDAGDTALHIAARKNAFDIVSFLLKNGAMASYKNKRHKKPIDCCFQNTKCYNLLKSLTSGKRQNSISRKRSITAVDSKYTEPKLKIAQLPIVFKTTSVLVSEDISHGCEDVPIRCVNEIDDELPIEFTYIKENCYDVGNHVDSAMSHIASCNCEGACNTTNCKCVQANGECLYNENGQLNSNFDYFNPRVILYECNLRCRCHKQQCGNRVIQKGIKINLELFKHKDMGWGVRTRQIIPRGTFVCEYVGEIITDQKANKLKEDSYLFNLENPGSTQLYCIDAFNYSNVSRFINHSCDPNLMSVRSFINHHDKRFPRIAFFAVQDIASNEQLYYDYGTAFWKIKSGLFTCKCGTSNCNFSSEPIKCVQIAKNNSHEKKTPVQVQSKKPKVKLPTVQLSNRNGLKTNKIILNKSLQENTKMSSSECSLVTKKHNNQKKNSNPLNSKSMAKNGLLAQNQNGVKCSEPLSDSQLKKIPELKMVQNKLQNVMVKKRVDEKVLNKNMSTTTDEKVFTMKDQFPESVRITDTEVVTTYLIKPKLLNPKKRIKIDDTVQNDQTVKVCGYQNNSTISLLDASSSDQDTVEVVNNSNKLMDFIKQELDDEEYESDLNMSNGESSYTSEEKYVKVKPGQALDIKTSFPKKHFLNSNSGKWSSIESFSDILLKE